MNNLEDQLNELLAESDRVAAELNRELFLIGRANAAIGYLRGIRQETARRVEALIEERAPRAIRAPEPDPTAEPREAWGPYNPDWPL